MPVLSQSSFSMLFHAICEILSMPFNMLIAEYRSNRHTSPRVVTKYTAVSQSTGDTVGAIVCRDNITAGEYRADATRYGKA